MSEKVDLEQALAELVYSIALVDGVLDDQEMVALRK